MSKKMITSRVLAIVGTVLVWIPILATLVTGVIGSIARDRLMIYYLMPGELVPFAAIGVIALSISAMLAQSVQKWIVWSFTVMLAALVLSQVVAVVSGLASGRIEATGIWWVLVLGLIILYAVVMVILGIGGIKLIISLFKKPQKPAAA